MPASHERAQDPLSAKWLYRKGDLVLGPLNGHQLIEKLYDGEIRGKTPIAPLGQNHFRPVSEVELFRIDLAKAEAKLRVDAVAAKRRARERQSQRMRIGIIVGVATVAAIGAIFLARYLAVHPPWKDVDEQAFGDITMEPPTIGVAKASNEDLVDYPSRSTRSGQRRGDRNRQVVERADKSSPRQAEAEPDGLKTENFDRQGISSIVEMKKRTLYPCLAEAAKTHPGVKAKVPIEFVIANDGRVSKVWVDNADYKEGPLPECLLKELQKWPFRPYEGERATVGLSFNLGKS
jgi:hypothetical protein